MKAKKTVVLTDLEGKLVDIARDHSGCYGDMEQKAYQALCKEAGDGVYESVLTGHLLELVERLAAGVRIVKRPPETERLIGEPTDVESLKLFLSGYSGDMMIHLKSDFDLEGRVCLNGAYEVSGFRDCFGKHGIKDAAPIRRRLVNGKKGGRPKLFLVHNKDEPYRLELR